MKPDPCSIRRRSSHITLRYLTLWFLFPAAVLITVAVSAAGAAQRAEISFLHGSAASGPSREGPWHPVRLGQSIAETQFVKTEAESRVELTLPDKSKVRIASQTVLGLEQVLFPETEPPSVRINLFFGRIWAKINKSRFGNTGRFQTRLPTAIVGVRGTVYDAIAAPDNSADIFVYEGIVGIGPPVFSENAQRDEVAFPAEVTERQWEEIILRQLQRLHIGADGSPGEPEAFAPDAVRDDWTAWNQERDASEN